MDVKRSERPVRRSQEADGRAASSTSGASSAACAPGARRSTILDTVHVEAYGSHDAAQPGGVAVDSRAHDDRRAAVRSVADGRDREGDPQLQPRAEPDQRRQGRPHPDAGADRGAPQGAVEAGAQVRRGGPQRRPPGPPRRQRPAEEAAQGPQDLRRRRAARPGRRAEDHRPAHRDRSTSCRRRRTPSCWASSIGFQLPVVNSESRSDYADGCN